MNELKFEVPGAGKILISEDAHNTTGGAAGFSFGVTWGKHGASGGILGRGEAVRLANHILKACEGITETEQQESRRRIRDIGKELM